MVGFEKNETLTPNQKLIAGCVAGGLTRFVTQPLDIIKLRTQLQKSRPNKDKRFMRTTLSIFKEEGLRAFWHGHNLGQVHSMLATTTQFYVYEVSTKYVMNTFRPHHHYKTFLVFLCGILAGCAAATLVLPLEVIRVRQMLVKSQYGGFLQGAKRVYATGGLIAFYEGLGASLLQMGPSVGISFAVFRFAQPIILDYLVPISEMEPGIKISAVTIDRPSDVLIASSLAGSMAGFVSKSLTYPFDLAKRRLQISRIAWSELERFVPAARNPITCRHIKDCMRKTWSHEGPKGLYRGWSITGYTSNVQGAVMYASFETVCFFLRHYKPEKHDND